MADKHYTAVRRHLNLKKREGGKTSDLHEECTTLASGAKQKKRGEEKKTAKGRVYVHVYDITAVPLGHQFRRTFFFYMSNKEKRAKFKIKRKSKR